MVSCLLRQLLDGMSTAIDPTPFGLSHKQVTSSAKDIPACFLGYLFSYKKDGRKEDGLGRP